MFVFKFYKFYIKLKNRMEKSWNVLMGCVQEAAIAFGLPWYQYAQLLIEQGLQLALDIGSAHLLFLVLVV